MRTSAIIRIIIWSILAIFLTGVLITGIVGNGWDFSGISFGSSSFQYDNADAYSVADGEVSLPAEEIAELEIHWVSGDINITAYDGDTIQIKETGVSEDEAKLRYRVIDGRLVIQFRAAGWNVGLFKDLKKDLEIRVPQTMAADMKEIVIESVSGEVSAEGLVCQQIDLEGVNGEYLLQGAFETIDCEIVNGELTLQASVCPKNVDVEAVNGSVVMTLPENEGFTATLDSVNGNLDCDFEGKAEKKSFVYGDGSATFDFETVNGGVRIQRG